ncbi:MAG: ABC transporter ATP-binding protein [Geminicoccaceae bacterium]
MIAPHQVLAVEGVWKKYARTLRASRRLMARSLRRALIGQPPEETLRPHEFWALQDVSLTVRRGEALGIIGLNGAGKSTLLNLIGSFLLPDRGRIAVRGAVGSLLDLTTGFQPRMSGVENIYIKGALLGRAREEMRQKRDAIVEFAELGDAIHRPVGGYSSGMRMRLAFAIAIHIEPSLLLMDEVLSVGDFRFRQKCLERVGMMRERTAFVMVSHSMTDVARFCERAIVLEAGRVGFEGSSADAIAHYQGTGKRPADSTRILTGERFHNPSAVDEVSHLWVDSRDQQVDSISAGDVPRLAIRFRLLRPVRRLIVGVPIWSSKGEVITGVSTDVDGIELEARPGKAIHLTLSLEGMRLNAGTYVAVIGIVDGSEFLYRNPTSPLEVQSDGRLTWGQVTPQARWTVTKDAPALPLAPAILSG